MHIPSTLRTTAALLLVTALAGCSSLWPGKGGKTPSASTPSTKMAGSVATPKAPASAPAAALVHTAEVQGTWQCDFQIQMGDDTAHFTYTDQFNSDGTLRAQAYLAYDMPSTQQQYAFVVQGNGHWRMEGNTITLIVPQVIQQDRSEHKNPDMLHDKDLVPEDLSDTWKVNAYRGKNMRVIAGSLADEMLCQKE